MKLMKLMKLMYIALLAMVMMCGKAIAANRVSAKAATVEVVVFHGVKLSKKTRKKWLSRWLKRLVGVRKWFIK